MTPYPPIDMPWWKSRVIVGALVSIVMKLLVVSGLAAEVTAEDSQQLVDLALILIGAVGDLVVIASRVRQKHAPAITAGGAPKGAALSVLLAAALVLPLASCSPLVPPRLPAAPAEVGETTKLDEQAALTITLAYTAAARAATLAIETGLVSDRAAIARIGAVDRRAYAAVRAAEAAYRAGNSASYVAALGEARRAVALLLSSIEGDAS